MNLQLQPHHADDEQVAALKTRVSEREAELVALKLELQKLQSRYLNEIGSLYGELSRIENEIEEIEIRLGLRPPETNDAAAESADDAAASGDAGGFHCSNRAHPSDELKKMFRDVAKSIHPDLAMDEPARWRRHSLMAEANRAYAERDADRLRLILRAWEMSDDAVGDNEPDAARRRVALLEVKLAAIEAEFVELRKSAIYRLKTKIDSTRAEGWDLFAEMRLQVKSEVARAEARQRRTAGQETGFLKI